MKAPMGSVQYYHPILCTDSCKKIREDEEQI